MRMPLPLRWEMPWRRRRSSICSRNTRPAANSGLSSTKSMTGHLLGGAGGLEAGITIMALQRQIVPPTTNLDDPDPVCDLNYTANNPQAAKVDVALSTSFA